MSSVVTLSVSSYPSTTIATESPTRIMSTPAPSTTRAVGASYAVTITSGVPEPLEWRIRGAVTGTRVEPLMESSSPVQGHSAPGGLVSVTDTRANVHRRALRLLLPDLPAAQDRGS